VAGVEIDGARRDLVLVATAHNSLYAFDADSGAPVWHENYGPAIPTPNRFWNTAWGVYLDLTPELGIISTPVVDRETMTIYFTTATWQMPRQIESRSARIWENDAEAPIVNYYLHAVDLRTHLERPGAPVRIEGSVPLLSSHAGRHEGAARLTFNPMQHLQRPGLLLVKGRVLLGFGGHADQIPYQGWVFAYDTQNLTAPPWTWSSMAGGAVTQVNGSGVWQAGMGLTTDAAGNVYLVTGNGAFDPSAAQFGDSDPALFGGAIAISGIAGDQQAATIGQACFTPGMIKSTYGTGCFALLNTGTTPVASKNKLLTTIAYQLNGKRTYALEGSIFVAGSAVQWLRDGLGIIKQASETGPLADKSDSMQSVYLVPAFVGLGAPYWNPRVRGALFGLTRNTGPAELAHAALESVCYQTFDLREAMRADWPGGKAANVLRVDGGMTASDWTMQRLADLLNAPVDRPMIQETTALGAAYLAGLQAGVYPEPAKFADNWRLEHRFKPAMSAATRERKLAGWARAVKGVLASDEGE